MSTTHNSLGTVISGFDALWAARDRRNAIDARIATLAAESNGNDKAAGKIAKLRFERVEVVKRIAALSGHAVGLANGTARRLAA